MKVLLINGSPNQTGCTYTALHEVETTLQANGIETELLYLGKKPIAGCIACGACMNTGHCFRDDLVQEIQKRIAAVARHVHFVHYHGKRHSCRKVHKKISITGFYGINKAATIQWRLYLYVKREKLSILII